jgi:hypothetical protein
MTSEARLDELGKADLRLHSASKDDSRSAALANIICLVDGPKPPTGPQESG